MIIESYLSLRLVLHSLLLLKELLLVNFLVHYWKMTCTLSKMGRYRTILGFVPQFLVFHKYIGLFSLNYLYLILVIALVCTKLMLRSVQIPIVRVLGVYPLL